LGALLSAGLSLVPTAAEAETVKLAVISESATSWPLYVAQDKGTFEAQGVTVNVTVTRSSTKQLQALEKGEFDIGTRPLTTS
jgi:ABC-type nitrate/sulfonate/bicarbonate transport system substrate-binding protein